MKVLGTYNGLPVSRAIRALSNSKSSHILFTFDDALMVQSSMLSGVAIGWFPEWLKHHKIAWSINVPKLTLEEEEEIYKSLMKQYGTQGYDYGAGAYWIMRRVEHRLFNTPIPKINAWQSPGRKLCIGVYEGLPGWLTGPRPTESEIEMTSTDDVGRIIADGMINAGIYTEVNNLY